jgi:hypothetical protein
VRCKLHHKGLHFRWVHHPVLNSISFLLVISRNFIIGLLEIGGSLNNIQVIFKFSLRCTCMMHQLLYIWEKISCSSFWSLHTSRTRLENTCHHNPWNDEIADCMCPILTSILFYRTVMPITQVNECRKIGLGWVMNWTVYLWESVHGII